MSAQIEYPRSIFATVGYRNGPDDMRGEFSTIQGTTGLEYVRKDLLPLPAAGYVALCDAASRLLREAELDGMESKAGWDCWMGNLRRAIAVRPASPDTRVVTVEQLAKWQCMTWAIGDSTTAAEIAAIIEGGQDRG